MLEKQNDENNEEWSNENIASFVIAACVVAILVCACFFFYSSYISPQKITKVDVKFVSSDSLLQKNYITREQVDSLIMMVKHQEAELGDKYQYLIEQKNNEEKYYSDFAIILSVVFSLFGFFGYKSITAIEQKSVKTAQEKAKKTAHEFVKNHVRQYVEEESKKLFDSSAANIIMDKLKSDLYPRIEEAINKTITERLKDSTDQDIEEGNTSRAVPDNEIGQSSLF